MHKWRILLIFFLLMLPIAQRAHAHIYSDMAHYYVIAGRLYSQHIQDHTRYLSFMKTVLSSGQVMDSRFNFWASGSLGNLEGGSPTKFVSDDEPIMVGLDTKVGPHFLLGAAYIQSHADSRIRLTGETATLNASGGACYVEYRQREDRQGFYLNSLFAYIYMKGDGLAQGYKGTQKANQYLGAFETGYRFPLNDNGLEISPLFHISSAYLNAHAFMQTGPNLSPLPTPAQHQTHTASTLAMHVSQTFEINDALSLLSDAITFGADVGYTHVFEKNHLMPQDVAHFGLEAFVKPSEAFGISMRGNFEAGQKYVSSLVSISLMYKW